MADGSLSVFFDEWLARARADHEEDEDEDEEDVGSERRCRVGLLTCTEEGAHKGDAASGRRLSARGPPADLWLRFVSPDGPTGERPERPPPLAPSSSSRLTARPEPQAEEEEENAGAGNARSGESVLIFASKNARQKESGVERKGIAKSRKHRAGKRSNCRKGGNIRGRGRRGVSLFDKVDEPDFGRAE
ncbi:hypothetical protein AXG93_1774s1130 [Marchantia polymorpha subsp. ruderalis]|uniref:Uncharacterized protein n=1 Tax=Marchantia polymorpha subsp. ruderalis TaxID=1480154 RepID=A0A176W300_MARPO|nr:hypothetical protein AXG93_1774s1130 [Marchantia polymorpha subsp. ruderalis]